MFVFLGRAQMKSFNSGTVVLMWCLQAVEQVVVGIVSNRVCMNDQLSFQLLLTFESCKTGACCCVLLLCRAEGSGLICICLYVCKFGGA